VAQAKNEIVQEYVLRLALEFIASTLDVDVKQVSRILIEADEARDSNPINEEILLGGSIALAHKAKI
jgi:hypothetical protein